MKKRALFSLYALNRVEEFAKSLSALGWEIIASRETHNILTKRGIPVIDIAKFVGVKENYGFPPTLHPKIEAYLTSSKGPRIDLVYVTPYPLSIGNDIGGRTLLALAAKGNRIPVMSVTDMEKVISGLKKTDKIPKDLHRALINKTNTSIASHFDDLIKERESCDLIVASFEYDLLNGENPYQIPSHLFSLKGYDSLSIHNFRQLSGARPCFTNLADSDSIIQSMCLACEAFNLRYKKIPYICIVAKHGNACGMAISWDEPCEAVDKALFGNPRSVWGGELIANFNIDKTIANLIFKSKKREEMLRNSAWMLDIILSPGFSSEAVKILGRRQNRKLLENKALISPRLPIFKYSYRFVRGGILRQPPNNFVLNFKKAKLIGARLNNDIIDSLIIAWSVVSSSNHGGNEIEIAKDFQLLAAGGGPSTVEAALAATMRARECGHDLKNSVFAANAFFPFTDAPQILTDTGLKAGVVPMGGRRSALVQAFFKDKGLSIIYLPEQYRGFCRH